VLVPLSPALAFVVIGLGGERLKRLEWGGWVAVLASFVALGLSLLVAITEAINPGHFFDESYTWLSIGTTSAPFSSGLNLGMGVLVDPISALMLVVVNVVGAMVMLYSIGYMHHDKGLPRYYAELSLFLTAMNGLVLSDNLLEFFLFWELVGVCSYFLIGFYYEKPSAASAAKEAFLVTRIGDVLFLLGIFIYFATFATSGNGAGWAHNGFKFALGAAPFLGPVSSHAATPLLTIAGLLMLAGAAGKSAQFPLDVWLPDAMEGPTTVSALIHAATMVAAGVYLLVVISVFIGFTPADQLAIVAVGGFTTFWAATMAVVQTDIKRVVAFSTVSQLGYMVLAVGAGFSMVGLYHLFTHAFFKALLFLAAGSVIHAVGTQDLLKMGGLKKQMPITRWAFIIGGLSLAGFPLFSGFFSKDDILASVVTAAQSHPMYWPFVALAFVATFLTGYYIFRAYYLAFSGDHARDPSLPHAHEGPWVMTVPLIILAELALLAGYLAFVPGFDNLFLSFTGASVHVPPAFGTFDLEVSAISVALGLSGIGLAYQLWGDGRVFTWAPDSPAQPLRRLLLNRYYVKQGADWFGLHVVYTFSRAADFVDRFIIDGTIHGFERSFSFLSDRMRRLQSGVVSDYAAYVVAGVIGLLVLLLFVAPWVVAALGGT
jgi:NADH-quinone oxidoreductase subunit L